MLGKDMSRFIVGPGWPFTVHAHSGHPGQELVFVHAGSVELGDRRTGMPDDGGYLDATVAHKLRQSSAEPAVVVVVAQDRRFDGRRSCVVRIQPQSASGGMSRRSPGPSSDSSSPGLTMRRVSRERHP